MNEREQKLESLSGGPAHPGFAAAQLPLGVSVEIEMILQLKC